MEGQQLSMQYVSPLNATDIVQAKNSGPIMLSTGAITDARTRLDTSLILGLQLQNEFWIYSRNLSHDSVWL